MQLQIKKTNELAYSASSQNIYNEKLPTSVQPQMAMTVSIVYQYSLRFVPTKWIFEVVGILSI